jgi:predicted aspartyl protease
MPASTFSNDLEQIGRAAKAKVDGLVGFAFIRDFRLSIEYQKNRLCFESAQQEPERSGAAAVLQLAITPAEALILAPVTVNGQGPFQFVLDTAAGRTVLSPDLVEHLRIPLDNQAAVAGAGGRLNASRADVQSLGLDGVTVRGVRAIVGQFLDTIGKAAGARIDGILAMMF